MPHLNRRGFTLVELLIALTLLAIVTAAFYRSLTTNQRVYQKQTQVIDLQQNLRAAASILPEELREVDASEGDIMAMTATSITFRARRWMAFMCSAPPTPIIGGVGTMVLRAQPSYGRGIVNGDSMFVRYEGDDGTRYDDSWALARATLIVSPSLLPCPDGKPGVSVTMNMPLGAAPNATLQNFANSIVNGSPVIGFETVTYALYNAAGTWYMGLTTAGGSQQPLIGPLLSNGVSFAYYDSTGAVTAVPARVARVDITVRAQTNQPVRATAGASTLARVVDSVLTSVALRNNRRY
jgi:prepilin-type N-terminal cleavage/methylation domain-containing protein